MRTIFTTLCVLTALAIFTGPSAAAGPDFNEYMLKSYKKLADPSGDRRQKGYKISSYFTRDLNYGQDTKAIKSKGAPYTMCVAAVTETIIEAINLYSADNPSWAPKNVIPTELWNRGGFTGIRAHLFSESLYQYPPLEKISKSIIPASLKTDIQKLHSEEAMAKALEKLGIGQRITFDKAKPGDVISFDRTNDTINGGHTYGGHSVVLLGFLDRNQNLISSYDASKVVGFKYFSSQGSTTSGGLSERWAYFKGFCPIRANYQLPQDPTKAGCADRIDNPQNRARAPIEASNQPTDCCLNKTGIYGPRVGRLFSPARWTFTSAYPAMEQEYKDLQARIKEFVRNRENASVRIALIANGATALEAKNPQKAARFIDKISSVFGVDLRTVASSAPAANLNAALVNKITRATPKAVINLANRQVTPTVKSEFEARVRNAETVAVAELQSTNLAVVPNPRLDSTTVD